MRDEHSCPNDIGQQDWVWFLNWLEQQGFVARGIVGECDLDSDLLWDPLDWVLLCGDLSVWLQKEVYPWQIDESRTVADLLRSFETIRSSLAL